MRSAVNGITNRLAITYGRTMLEIRMLAQYLRSGWGADLVLSRGRILHAARGPTTVGVELTNVCQLRCPHCDAQHPDIRGKPGYMSEDTFGRMVDQLRTLRVRNLRLIGGGEPLLHPRFAAWVPRLRGLASILSITTNGQRLHPDISAAALGAVDVIEVSVASDNAAGFARSRTGGDFGALLENLTRLRVLRDHMGSRTAVHIRVMVRPSEQPTLDRLLAFWRRYGDVVSTQRLQDYFDQHGDVYARSETEEYPPCVLPFRSLGVSWDGSVPLCRVAAFQTGSPDGLVLGNINQTTLAAIWQGSLLSQYRAGHRNRDPALMPVCRNCPDPQRPAWSKNYETNAHVRPPARPAPFIPVRALSRRREPASTAPAAPPGVRAAEPQMGAAAGESPGAPSSGVPARDEC